MDWGVPLLTVKNRHWGFPSLPLLLCPIQSQSFSSTMIRIIFQGDPAMLPAATLPQLLQKESLASRLRNLWQICVSWHHHHQQPWPPHQIVNRILFKISCKCWHWSLPGRDMWTWQSKNPHGFSTPDKSWSQLTSKQDNTWDLLSLQQQNLSHMSYIHTGHKTFKVLLGVLKCCAFCHIPQTKEVFI